MALILLILAVSRTHVKYEPSIQGCQPPHLQILRIDREGIIDDVIMHKIMTSFVQKDMQNDVVGIVTFVPDCFTSHQSHYCLYYNGIYWGFLGNVQC